MTALKTAILLTAGAVGTYSAFIQSGPRHLKTTVTRDQYMMATQELENIHMGSNITTRTADQPSGRTNVCFVKKPPNEVIDVLAVNPDLCTISDYTVRYNLLLPNNVNLSVETRHLLLEGRYVSSEAQLVAKNAADVGIHAWTP